MECITQFSVFMANKPGVLAQICRAMAKEKINITAMSMMDTMENGVLRIIAEKPDKARAVLQQLNVPTTETEVLSVPLPNRPGAVADVCERLSKGHVHVAYMYATAAGRGAKTTCIFKVGDIRKAMRIIESSKLSGRRDMRVKLRRPAATRRR